MTRSTPTPKKPRKITAKRLARTPSKRAPRSTPAPSRKRVTKPAPKRTPRRLPAPTYKLFPTLSSATPQSPTPTRTGHFPSLNASLTITSTWSLDAAHDAISPALRHPGEFVRWEPRSLIQEVARIAREWPGEKGLREFQRAVEEVWEGREGREEEVEMEMEMEMEMEVELEGNKGGMMGRERAERRARRDRVRDGVVGKGKKRAVEGVEDRERKEAAKLGRRLTMQDLEGARALMERGPGVMKASRRRGQTGGSST